MLVLLESPAGYALFKVLDEGKLKDAESTYEHFQDASKASKIVKMKAFSKFKDNADALEATAALVESKLSKGLKKFLQKNIVDKGVKDSLAIADAKLGGVIKDKLGIACQADSLVTELMRGLRLQMANLIEGLTETDLKSMQLGLSHSLSRHKLKFSPEKVDTMIVQAISLLDDVDKELNTYAMRVKEWYGWHFPEMAKVVTDNIVFAKVVMAMGVRSLAASTDLSELLDKDTEQELRDAAQVSMGTEISDEDLDNIKELAQQVIDMAVYRNQLFEYLQNRMRAVAPNLTTMVGELVGARLIAHAGSLVSLAKQPASTVQILGAEKALFRALKTKHETPKYGLIYHASLIGQATPKNKGKIARVLASKATLSARVDALAQSETAPAVAVGHRAAVESRLYQLEGRQPPATTPVTGKKLEKASASTPSQYNDSADVTVGESAKKKSKKDKKDKSDKGEKTPKSEKKSKKRSRDEDEESSGKKSAKKSKKDKKSKD